MKLLVISPFFFPENTVGALRMTSLVRYLVDDSNVQITVIKEKSKCNCKKEKWKALEVNYSKNGYVNKFLEYNKVCKELLKRDSYDCCIISCGPFHTLLCGLYIRIRYNIPYIIDYRDLWNNERIKSYTLVKNFINKLVIGNASLVTVATPKMKEAIIRESKINNINKIQVIMNGFERVNINFSNSPKKNSFTIGILGKFSYYSESNTEEFLQAIAILQNQGLDVNILHIGDYENCVGTYLKKYNINEQTYRCTGRINYEQAIQNMEIATCGLIISANEKIGFSSMKGLIKIEFLKILFLK